MKQAAAFVLLPQHGSGRLSRGGEAVTRCSLRLQRSIVRIDSPGLTKRKEQSHEVHPCLCNRHSLHNRAHFPLRMLVPRSRYTTTRTGQKGNPMKNDELPTRLRPIATRLVSDLKSKRESGEVYPEHGATGKRIANGYTGRLHTRFTDVDIREVVHYLRAVEHAPIGSDSSGYFYALSPNELQHAIAQLESRVRAQQSAINGLRLSFNQSSLF